MWGDIMDENDKIKNEANNGIEQTEFKDINFDQEKDKIEYKFNDKENIEDNDTVSKMVEELFYNPSLTLTEFDEKKKDVRKKLYENLDEDSGAESDNDFDKENETLENVINEMFSEPKIQPKIELNVIIDLDETLIKYLTNSDLSNFISKNPHYDVLSISYDKIFNKSLQGYILVRRHVIDFIIELFRKNCNVYILTAGTQDYCDSVWFYLMSLLNKKFQTYEEKEKKLLYSKLRRVRAKSCRDVNDMIPYKHFNQVHVHENEWWKTVAIDNYHTVWTPMLRSQVLPVPDFDPFNTIDDEDKNVWDQILNLISDIGDYLNDYTKTKSLCPVADCISDHHENLFKRALSRK